MSGDGADRLRAGREALQHHAWHQAFEALYAADTALPLTPTDLELLGEAAQWVGRLDQSIAAYERAHARYLEQGNRRRAGFMAVQVAHGHFARAQRSLGSGWLRRAERLLDSEQDSIEYGHQSESQRTETRTFMFTDIVGSTQLVEAIGDEAWADLVRWHDQALRALFTSHSGEEVDHAGDGFFVAFPSVRSALDCGVAIQRALLEHRRRHGFAPQVRIGLHAAAAQRHGDAFRGKGVHVAARVAALAEAGEILASRGTVESPPPGVTLSAPRAVTLKGLSEPLEIVTLGWR
jgi:class 3 adenylate cyclase